MFLNVFGRLEAVWVRVGKFLEDLGCFRTFWNAIGCLSMFGDILDVFRHFFGGGEGYGGWMHSNQPTPPNCHFKNSVKILGVTGKLAL